MTHRDELLALRARIEAQDRKLDEAKSENELLRAAHASKTRQAEELRRELEADRVRAAEGESEPLPEAWVPGPREMRQHELARSMRAGVVGVTFLALVGSMMLMLTPLRHAQPRGTRLVHGMPLATSTVTPLVRVGTVASTSGPEVVAVGTECTVARMPAYAGAFDCRIEVRCGEQTLYGADPRTGFVRCEGREVVSDANVATIDGDPAMTLDLGRGIVTLEDRVGLATQRVQIDLR